MAEQVTFTDAMADAVSSAVSSAYPGDVVTKWLVIAEVLDGDSGSRAMVMATQEGTTPWDSLGLLQYALQREQSRSLMDMLDTDDD